jgi:hypothetical protein
LTRCVLPDDDDDLEVTAGDDADAAMHVEELLVAELFEQAAAVAAAVDGENA